jgi:Leucine-rich repeat (LRR) protein
MEFNIEDYLNSLPLDTKIINVSFKKLTYLPDLSRFKQLEKLVCSKNELKSLPPLPNSLIVLFCPFNPLTELPQFNNNLEYIECSYCQLTSLPPLNNNLKVLHCYRNEITELPPLNNKLKILHCYNNKIFHKKQKYNKNIIKTLLNFRFTFYCLKLKNKFKRWLWEKVREPKVMAKFHPDHLTNLEETDDLEVFLDNWIK